MNHTTKETVRNLAAELRDVLPETDRPKLKQLTRIVGELRRERGQLSTRVAELASQRDTRHAAAAKADSESEKRIAAMEQRFAKSESLLRAQIAERNDIIANLSQRNGVLNAGLYPIATGPVVITKKQLLKANDESIRLNFNRTLEPDFVESLPDQNYIVMGAFYHVGFSGREFEQLNYRLMLTLCQKPAHMGVTADDMEHAVLDVSADMWDEFRKHVTKVQMD